MSALRLDDYWSNGEVVPSTVDFPALFHFAKRKRGWVYVAQSSQSGALKIGRTSKTPQQRMLSLETAGVEGTFTLLHAVAFVNSHWAESSAHQRWQDHNIRKEFFQVDPSEAYAHLLDVQHQVAVLLNEWPRNTLLYAPSLPLNTLHADTIPSPEARLERGPFR